MASAIVKRPVSVTEEDITVNLSYGDVQEIGDAYYIPLTVDDVVVPDITVAAVTGTDASAVLTTATVGGFDTVRVGDQIKSFSGVGDAGTVAIVLADSYVPEGLKEIKYTEAYEVGLAVKAGDAISGTGIGVGALVDKIDVASRTIYTTVANTASGVADVTFTAPARVIAVRKSTEATNPNQITLDRAVVTGPTAESVVIGSGIKEAAFAVLRLNPQDNATGSRLNYNIGVSYPNALNMVATANGIGVAAYDTLGYTGLQGISVDVDTFLTGLRVPRSV
jgi:hypothetical protein